MSANASISEGDKGYPFGPVKALMVQGDNGKYYPWYPESDRALDTLSVDKNGIYRASDNGVYGWGSVSVNVSQAESVTGRDPDTGEEVVIRPGPDGELEEIVVPVEIRVIEPPTNPYVTYIDGQTITKDGMVVKAYLASGELWTDESHPDGVVPNGEITINPTVAVYDESKDPGGRRGIATLDGVSIDYAAGAIHCDYPAIVSSFDYCVRVSERTHRYYKRTNEPISIFYYASGWEQSYPVSYGGQTPGGVQYYTAFFDVGSSTLTIIPSGTPDIAEILYDGTHEEEPAGSPQTITVSWPRPGDGAILETTFDINVGPRSGQGDD